MSGPLLVLLVEDNPADARLVRETLPSHAFEVQTVERLAGALAAVRARTFEAALLDLGLPDSQGLDTLSRFREMAPRVPVVTFTGLADEDMALDALRLGAQDYVVKGRFNDELLGRILRYAVERQRVAEALRESEQRHRALMERANDGISVISTEGRLLEINQRLEEMVGVPRARVVGRHISEFTPDARSVEAFSQVMMRGSGHIEDVVMVRPDGGQLTVDFSLSTVEVGGQKVVLSIGRDVTERKQAEARQKQSEEQYRLLFDHNPHPMWVFDQETLGFLAVNEAAVTHYGYSREEFLAMGALDLRPPGQRAAFQEAYLTHLATEGARGYRSSGTWQHRKRSGDVIEVEIAASAITFRDRRAWLILATDLTEKKDLQAQLMQSQKMESIGRLAGGVAHDFNNLLGVIGGYGELLRKRLDQEPRLQRYAVDILKAADRAAGLTRQLLAFSRKQILQPRILDLNAVVGEMEKMLRRLIGEDVQLVTVFHEHLGPVRADPGQMEQVLMNLAVNARDAMPQGGRLTIETDNVELDETYSRQRLDVDVGQYVMLAVSDTGVGMSPEVRARAFEPFFTTKEAGKGTGLGLSTVHGIVKQSGGHVWVYSEPGEGTAFKIYLPRSDDAPDREGEAGGDDAPHGSETVLLVEDEEALRELISECLQAWGYTVLQARDGVEAVELCVHHPEPIHLLITDVVMPRMSGRELAAQLRGARPHLRVLYMSGYTDDAVVLHGLLAAEMAFLQKPFTAQGLARKVREVLDAARG